MNDLKFALRQLLKNPGQGKWIVGSDEWRVEIPLFHERGYLLILPTTNH